ncbi:MAG: acylphosphatase [Betaproteobacteria bacterium]|nr:acylphosphatase [Betaproteobacteria bacterium]
MSARRVLVHGQVQGVGFRYAMCRQATHLGVQGWVRNRRDGAVEAHIEGADGAMAALIEWARGGPAGAGVSHVEVELAAEGSFAGFDIRPTA